MKTSKVIMKGDPRVTVMHKTEKIPNLNKPGVVGVTQEKDAVSPKSLLINRREENAQVNPAQVLICTWLPEQVLVKIPVLSSTPSCQIS